jgi:hypothetical protein
MQMYQVIIKGIVGSFPASQSYTLIFLTAILMSIVSIVLVINYCYKENDSHVKRQRYY